MLLLARCTLGFVLTPANVTSLGLASGARRWHTPADASSHDGLGGGIAFIVEPTFCVRVAAPLRAPSGDPSAASRAARAALARPAQS